MSVPVPDILHVRPTKLMPNNPKPLLHYKGVFLKQDGQVDTDLAFDTFVKNGWEIQWVTRYGRSQRAHYHSDTHEMMIIMSGPGHIRWGVADLSDEDLEHTYGDAYETGGLEMLVHPGDCFVIPAGVSHKHYDPDAKSENFGCLTGDARGVEGDDPKKTIRDLELYGFMMMGAYPKGKAWDWSEGGDHLDRFEKVWNVPNPSLDPVVGDKGGTNKYWKHTLGRI